MQPFFNAIEEVSCGDHHLKSDGLGQLNTNGISSLLVNHAWTGDEGVDTDPGWHGVTERSHTPPLSEEYA